MNKEYKAIKNYIHNELGLTKEDIINVIRLDIKQCVERCMRNTYGDDNNLERWIKVMVENELQNIEIDEEYALMTKQTFEGLREYSVAKRNIVT